MTDNELAQLLALAEAGRRSRVVPALLSGDLDRTEEFYVRLGFTAEAVGAGRRGFERDGHYLFFHDDPPHGTPVTPTMSGTVYFFPDSVDELAEEWRGEVEFLWGPELMPYGLYEFGIADPDGYLLAFAERRA